VGCRSCSFLWVETESGHDVAHTPYEVFRGIKNAIARRGGLVSILRKSTTPDQIIPTGQTSSPLKMSWFCVYDIECPIKDSIRFYTLSNE